MNFNPLFDMRQAMEQARNEKAKIEISLRNGKTLSGRVGEVGHHFFVLAELSGKEFYDALIRIDDVCSIEVRARDK